MKAFAVFASMVAQVFSSAAILNATGSVSLALAMFFALFAICFAIFYLAECIKEKG